MTYKLLIIKHSDLFMGIMYDGIEFHYLKLLGHNLKDSHRRHIYNF